MALQVRRGSDAERSGITPLDGELIYVTDTNKLYVGNGSTVGGQLVEGSGSPDLAGLNDVDVIGVTNGQLLAYNTSAGKWSPVPASLGGVIEGSNYRINIVGNDSSIMVDTAALVVTANLVGDSAGVHTGDHIGSVFADDSTLIVDGINNIVYASSVQTNVVQAAGVQTLVIESGATGTALSISGVTSGSFGGETSLTIDSSKGTLASPQDTIAGDIIGALKVRGLNNGSQVIGSIQQTFWDASANFSETYPKSGLRLMANAGDGKGTLLLANGTPTGFNHMTLRSDGALEGPIFKMIVVADTTARDALITAPEAGMIVFVTDVAKFQGYDDSAWVNLN